MPAPAPAPLSKSKVMAGIQCLKRLYLEVRQPELAAGPVDEAAYARMEEGQEVGTLAQQMFPGGRAIGFDRGKGGALAETAAAIADPSIPAIFEATLQHSGVLVRIDILERIGADHWRLIEVKSSLDVKPIHLQDLAIQHHVAAASGLAIHAACLMHLSREYLFDGGNHALTELFKLEDMTSEIDELEVHLPELLTDQWAALAGDAPPEIAAGPHCSDPYVCRFFDHCNTPHEQNHISSMPNLRGKKLASLVELGVSLIHEIPEDFPLTENQERVCRAVKTGQPWVSESLSQDLAELGWPRYFMDFESFNPAIPRFTQMRPYSQIPFQWSVHRQMTADAELEHFEFLEVSEADPREAFLESLYEVLGIEGPVIVYSASFESNRLREIAAYRTEHSARVSSICERLWDLLPFVRRHIYHPDFHGSFSIKSVLPALVPGMTYEGMEVADGVAAGLAWKRIVRSDDDDAGKQRLTSALLAYCGQDTLAMVKLIHCLHAYQARSASTGSGS